MSDALPQFVVHRTTHRNTQTYRYFAEVGIDAVMDKKTADEYEHAEAWLVDGMLDRMIAQLLEWRKNGVRTRMVKSRDPDNV